jgi:exodeoxyribonuclease VII large subunit
MTSRPAIANPVREVERHQEQVTALTQRARRCLGSALNRAGDDLSHTRARLLALSPASTLRRGYAIVQHADDGVVRSATEVSAGEPLTIRFAKDQLSVAAVPPPGEPAAGTAPRKAAPRKAAPRKTAPGKTAPGKQPGQAEGPAADPQGPRG